MRPKFRSYASEDETRRFVAIIRDLASIAPDPPAQRGLTADPHDDYLVALARATHASVLVSGDRHLLDLVAPEPPVLSPRAFVTRLDAG